MSALLAFFACCLAFGSTYLTGGGILARIAGHHRAGMRLMACGEIAVVTAVALAFIAGRMSK